MTSRHSEAKAGKRNRLNNIPIALRKVAQWVCSDSHGRPINPRTGTFAKSNDAATWGTFEEAARACATFGHEHVAFALTEHDPFCIVDLDDKPSRPASEEQRALFDHIIKGLDSYTELSRGGRGFHIVVKGKVEASLKTAHVEIYCSGHFVTLTGNVVGKSKPVRERSARVAEITRTLRPAKPGAKGYNTTSIAELADETITERATAHPTHGEKFSALHRGLWEPLGIGDGSQSAADLAYIGMLWNAGGSPPQIQRLFQASKLGQREKGQRADYISRMIDKVTQSPPRDWSDDGAASRCSDLANAYRIEAHLGESLRFVPDIGWHVWEGARWKHDPWEARRLVGQLGRIVLNESAIALSDAAKLTDRDQSERLRQLGEKLLRFASQTENVVRMDAAMTAAEPLLRCDAGQLDADPYMLGCTNGVVDLRTGELHVATKDQLISKSTGTEFDPHQTCPKWMGFLKRVFRAHPDVPAFMQLLAGYWLTGLTDPPVLAVLYGVGANGKSTLVDALAHAMGDYASSAPPGLLMARYGDRHPTELAALQGKRLVVAVESDEGGRLDEQRIKALTGSDLITARRMRENFYTFRPTHSFVLMTNHKPIVKGVDEGIWRRLLLIPFDEVIPESERDPTLAKILRSEKPGILAWAVEGAKKFTQTHSLVPPTIVTNATAAYRTESDVLGEFLTEECEPNKQVATPSSLIFARYEGWCDENGERPVSKRMLGLRLQDRGYTPAKDRRGQRIWRGLALRSREVLKHR